MKVRILIIAFILTCIFAISCDNSKTTNLSSDGAEDILYKYGKIEFVDFLEDSDIYYGDYMGTQTRSMSASYTEDIVIYTHNASVYTNDENLNVLSLCHDPVCDHSKRESCIVSYGLVRDVVFVDDYTYFLKATGIYRYSHETLTTEPYAVFNIYIATQFRMGRYLYAELNGGEYIKIDLATDQAIMLEPELLSPRMVFPYKNMLYCYDSENNIYRCDQNFQNAELLVSNITTECWVSHSYQVYNDYLYYVTVENDVHYLMKYDLAKNALESRIEGVYCFWIYDDFLYTQQYDPSEGPLYQNGDNIVPSTIKTGNKVYRAHLSDPTNREVIARQSDNNMRLDGYGLYVTERFIYSYIANFVDYDIITNYYRYDMVTNEWQQIG